MLITVLFSLPLLVTAQFIPIEKDSTTIAPPIAHGNRKNFFRGHHEPSEVGSGAGQGNPLELEQAEEQRQRRPVSHPRRRKHHRKHEMSPQEAEYLRQLEENDERREQYKEAVKAQRDQYYQQYFDRMKVYAIETHIRKYNQMLAQQQAEREKFAKTMREFGVREEDVLRQIGSDATATEAPGNTHPPSAPF